MFAREAAGSSVPDWLTAWLLACLPTF